MSDETKGRRLGRVCLWIALAAITWTLLPFRIVSYAVDQPIGLLVCVVGFVCLWIANLTLIAHPGIVLGSSLIFIIVTGWYVLSAGVGFLIDGRLWPEYKAIDSVELRHSRVVAYDWARDSDGCVTVVQEMDLLPGLVLTREVAGCLHGYSVDLSLSGDNEVQIRHGYDDPGIENDVYKLRPYVYF